MSIATLVAALGAGASDPVADNARMCAETFGIALKSGDPRQLGPMLPQRGKVRLRLVRLGAEQGSFSAGQVQAVFKDFFKNGSVQSFDLVGPGDPDTAYALVRARATLVDRDGMPATVDLHLILELEGERWILREIGEAQR